MTSSLHLKLASALFLAHSTCEYFTIAFASHAGSAEIFTKSRRCFLVEGGPSYKKAEELSQYRGSACQIKATPRSERRSSDCSNRFNNFIIFQRLFGTERLLFCRRFSEIIRLPAEFVSNLTQPHCLSLQERRKTRPSHRIGSATAFPTR